MANDKISSYKLSPQLRTELHFTSRRNRHSFDFELVKKQLNFGKLPWKAILLTVFVCALVISGYLGIKKGYDYVAEKNYQANLAREQEYQNHLKTVEVEVAKLGTDAYSFVALSQNYVKSGDGERAEAAAQVAIQKDPLWRDAYVNLGQVYLATNKFDQAKTALENALKKDPVYGQTHYLLSLVYQELNDEGKSKDEFAKAKQFGFESEIGG